MNKATPTRHATSAASRWRRQPIYATTRLRCAVAMMVFALAVGLSALPSLAKTTPCDALTGQDACTTASLYHID